MSVFEQEFDCAECSRHIVRFIHHADEPLICAECLFMPGWFRDDKLRKTFDPELPAPPKEEP